MGCEEIGIHFVASLADVVEFLSFFLQDLFLELKIIVLEFDDGLFEVLDVLSGLYDFLEEFFEFRF